MSGAENRAHLDPRRHADKPLGLRIDHEPLKGTARGLDLDKYADTTVEVPAVLSRTPAALAYQYGMLDNDTYGCCVPAAAYHLLEALRLKFGISPYPWAAATCLATYFAVNGVPPGPPGSSSDQGTDPSAMMAYWQATGLAPDHKLIGWGFVPPTSPNARRCIAEFGGALLAVELSTQQQSQGTDWTYVPGQQCGSWGGHGIACDTYDENGFDIITWGEFGSADDAFVSSCGDGFWVPLTEAQIGPGGVGPFGFDFAQMQSDLATLTQGETD
jgi:hypothetical protein